MFPSPTASPARPNVPVGAVIVAVPARDEADRIESSLRSICAASTSAQVRAAIVLAADSCTDDTAAVAQRSADSADPAGSCSWHVVEGHWSSASRARAAAIAAGLDAVGPIDRNAVWIANTDADCTVPRDWLTRQLEIAADGADAVAGIVRLDPATTCPQLLSSFVDRYGVAGDTHRHVHAANLGVRADVYARLGGWCSHTVLGEEHALWRRLRSGGFDVRQPTDVVVTTSCRTVGRVRGGFATALARLVERPSQVPHLSDQEEAAGRSRLANLETTTS